MTALFRRAGCHAAPLHESLPVAWHRWFRPARRLAAAAVAWRRDLRADTAALNAVWREAFWQKDPRPLQEYRGKLRAASDRRPARQPARGSVRVQTRLLADEEPEAGPSPISPPGPAGTVPADGPPLKAGTVPLRNGKAVAS